MKRRALWWIAWLALAPTLAMAQATNPEGKASNFGKTNPQPAVQSAPNATTITPDASTADQVVQTNTQAGASLTINGVNLKAAGNSTVTFGGASQTVTSQSSTAPVITAARSTNKYGVGLNLILTDSNSVASNTFNTTGIIAQAGWSFVNLGSLVASGNRITAVSDLVSGDQVAYDTKVGLVTVSADGSFVADPSVVSFNVEAWTASAWGTTATQTINATVGLNANGGWFMFTR